MSRKSNLMRVLAIMMVTMLTVGFVSCGSDDDNEDLNNGQPVNPGTTVNDPEGTISLSMRNADNGETYLDNIYISKENFRGAYFASVGAVKGLGNVYIIPTTGWAEQMSVIAGNGYVAYSNNQFYRIYVVSDIVATTGGVIGADIKYQKPFKGVDEAISIDEKTLTFSATGGSQSLVFNNKNILIFDAASDQSWCRVQKCSTNDYYFLYNGIYITCEENSSSSSREAIVSIKTVYEKEVKIKVIQAGQEPFVTMGSASVEVTSREQKSSVSFATNVDVSELEITGATSWCKAEISTANSTKAEVKFIGNKPAQTTRASGGASQSYNLILQLSENSSEDKRVANIAIKSSKYNIQGVVKVVQKGVTFEVSQSLIMFDRTRSNATITITTTASSWNAKSSDDWCTFTTNGDQLTIRATSSTVEREAKITFSGFRQEIIIRQSKYAVGDEYNEGNITGTVGFIGSGKTGEDYRMIYKSVGSAVWSTEKVSTGANSATDGQYNMNIIKQIDNWRELYPAFALCDALNTNGVTGWYLPSYNESLLLWNSNDIWTSTECSYRETYTSYYENLYGSIHKGIYSKDMGKRVFAIRKF